MKRYLTWLFYVVLVAIVVFSSPSVDLLSSSKLFNEGLKNSDRSPGRSLSSIPSEHETPLMAYPDGTIHLRDRNSEKILWSFSSGSSLYTFYRAPMDQDNDKDHISRHEYIYCGDNGELNMVTRHGKIIALPFTIDEFISNTPQITEDGVLLGSKKTTVFVIDAKSGRLIQTYGFADSPSIMQSDKEKTVLYDRRIEKLVESGSIERETAELPLYITRTDYSLKFFASNTSKVMWEMTIAEIGAAFLCPNRDNPFGGPYELDSQFNSNFDMPLPCQSKVVVSRYLNHNMLQSLHKLYGLPISHLGAMPLPESPSSLMITSQPTDDKNSDSDGDNIMFPEHALAPFSENRLPSQPRNDKFLDFQPEKNEVAIRRPPNIINTGTSNLHYLIMYYGSLSMLSKVPVALFIVVLVGYVSRCALLGREAFELGKPSNNSNVKIESSKRKKNRKSAKNNGSIEKKDRLSSENEDGSAHFQSDTDSIPWLKNLNRPVRGDEDGDGDGDGETIGNLFVSNIEIAKGSNGTVVLEGKYAGRAVAVKRLVRAHHDVAGKEIQNLIASDQHPNIVRWHGVEYDQHFVYISLERCTCNLDDLIQICSNASQGLGFKEQSSSAMIEYKLRLDSVKVIVQDVNLWKANCYPSPVLLQLMRDVVLGLVHLHELGIIHRDLKPQNVLISKERCLCAKLSDMGISKRLLADMSSLEHHTISCGSSGWQAPEQLLHGRQTRAMDLFSLGCVLFFCITGGRHPFGDHHERDYKIVKNQTDLFLVECIPEAVDLFSDLLKADPELRPKAVEVLHHPLFWSSEIRLSFLRDTSDRVELEDRETDSDLLNALESIASIALGGKWDEKMEPAFITNIGRYRRYKYDSVRDLLRVIRNKLNHYRELPKEIQELLGPVPEGFDGYFAGRFPKFFMQVYKVVKRYCKEEECFQKYFKAI